MRENTLQKQADMIGQMHKKKEAQMAKSKLRRQRDTDIGKKRVPRSERPQMDL